MVVLLDTSFIIDHLRQIPKESKLTRLLGTIVYTDLRLSLVTIQELYAGESTKQYAKEKDLLTTVSQFAILPYTYEIAKLAGEITRDLGKGHPLDLADAAIAATAIHNHCELATLNPKDFLEIPNLSLVPSTENK